jgi:phage/plasmid-like protein (TIGR03299 family)
MSRETMQHLNTNTLIGNTAQRGHAWHYRADLQGEESNHYPGPIPIEDVRRRLFDWQADSRRLAMEIPSDLADMTHLDDDGRPMRWEIQPDLQAIARSDNDHRLGVFTDSYQRHQYDTWLLDTVANLLDDGLSISSAGLLRDGAIAWVEISVPESIRTPEGVVFRPNCLATTSFDGSIATTFKRTVTDVVCDNTRAIALTETGQQYKVKHSRYSRMRIADARQALAMIHVQADAFAEEVARLCRIEVTDRQWRAFLDAHVPLSDPAGKRLEGRALTNAENKRITLNKLYTNDIRVQPWAGTAHGVLQAVNTYEHHENSTRGIARGERNMLRTVTGDFDTLDRQTWQTLEDVLAQ